MYSAYWLCPKCESRCHEVRYDHSSDLMAVTCGKCGYTEMRLPRDAP